MDAELLRLTIADESDVFLVRQRGREVAAAVGLEHQDQVRVATVLSDLGRDLLRLTQPPSVEFLLSDVPRPSLVIEISGAAGLATIENGVGWESGVRLMDEIRTDEGGMRVVKYLPAGVTLPDGDDLARLRRRLRRLTRASAVDELRSQNEELVRTLENLAQLNAELEETNKGVVALYKELSAELEQTNRGVVALYAELDDKSTQLTEANRAKNRFWSNISHELRTPINSIIGLARLLVAPGSDELTDEQRHQVDLVADSGGTLLALVNELLDTAKAESGQLVAQHGPVRLAAVFGQLRGMLRPLATSDDVRLRIEEPPALPAVLTDEVLLLRILRNLLSNGLKFTRSGEVRLTVEPADEWLVFLVSDTGIGIPADQQIRVFEEFYQVPGELRAQRTGTGLGLPYARKLAEILGGSLTLASEVGRGTSLTLRIPLRHADGPPVERMATLLVVDDDAEFRRRLAELAADLACRVIEAHDGWSALAAAAEHRPDLILLDLWMPGMNGDEVLAALRRAPATADTPVVIVTSADLRAADLVDVEADPAVIVLAKSGISRWSLHHAVSEILSTAGRTSRP
jgi:signal transduction histidine kinase/CheY-like chemotaxis protein